MSGSLQKSSWCKYLHAVNPKDEDLAPDAEDSSKKVPTMMTNS